MQTDRIVLVSPEELQNLVRNAVRKELTAATKQSRQRELLNAREICEFLNIHISTLNTWKAEGKIPFKRLGKRIFFNREEVLSSLKEDGTYKKMKELK